MVASSPDGYAAIRAIQGDSNLHDILPALRDRRFSPVIALAPDAHPIVRAIAALLGKLPNLLDTRIVNDPALHDVVALMIGTDDAWNMLWTLAHVAPAGWGAMHANALITVARNDISLAVESATLIGPRDDSAALLHRALDIAIVISRWGKSLPDNPTAWMEALSKRERDRLIDTVLRDSHAVARCIPWLPPNCAYHMPRNTVSLNDALEAFTDASPTARALHAEIVQHLVAHANLECFANLTRLACTMEADAVWSRVATLVRRSPDDAARIVVATPWNDLANTVRDAILEHASDSDICAAIAAAQGRDIAVRITSESATAFFAALDPNVWDELPSTKQEQWRDALYSHADHLSVRSLGLRPEFLARMRLSDDLTIAARRHAPNTDALRWALFPVALRAVVPVDEYTLIAAMPTLPPDPSAFFVIATGRADPSVIPAACTTLRTPDNLALASVMQRCTEQSTPIQMHCAALHHALRRRTWDALTPIMTLLSDNARAVCMPDPNVLVKRLARPERRKEMRQTLAFLATLPPEVAVPTCVALSRQKAWEMSGAAEAIADALHAYGDVFLAIVDAIANTHLRDALLPLPKENTQANTLRALARENPQTAQRMAHALRSGDWRAATDIALHLSAQRRDALTPSADALVERLAHPSQRNALRQALDRLDDLSLDSAILTRFALIHAGTYHQDMHNARMAAEDVARTLHDHGDVFLAIFDAIANKNLRNALLPLPKDVASANALRNLARDDPPSAHRLAHARRDHSWYAALHTLLTAPPRHADAIWQTFTEAERHAITSEVPTVTPTIAALAERDPIAALALAATQANDADLRGAGIAALAARSDVLRAIWLMLPQEMRQFLRSYPALSDLTETTDYPPNRRFLRR